MRFDPGHLISTVFVLSVGVFAGALVLSTIAILRRLQREKDLAALAPSRDYIFSILNRLLDDSMEYSMGLSLLLDVVQNGNKHMAERLLFERKASPKSLPLLQKLAEDLGLLRAWQCRLEESAPDGKRRFRFYGQGLLRRFRFLAFLARARSADRLGRIHHRASWRLLVKGLNDPNSDVQAVALRSLANIGEAQSFPFLIERLRAAGLSAAGLSDTGLSERELTAALARFPPQMARCLTPLLEDSNPRLRRLATDVLLEMACAQTALPGDLRFTPDEFGRDVVDLILTRLPDDENPDVRARAADLLGQLGEEHRASRCLARLMADREWYVRLHAVRAAGKKGVEGWVPLISGCLKDPHWRVREAAAHALAGCGPAGTRQLLDTFLSTEDIYAREQILEEFELCSIAADQVTHDGEAGREMETQAVGAIA